MFYDQDFYKSVIILHEYARHGKIDWFSKLAEWSLLQKSNLTHRRPETLWEMHRCLSKNCFISETFSFFLRECLFPVMGLLIHLKSAAAFLPVSSFQIALLPKIFIYSSSLKVIIFNDLTMRTLHRSFSRLPKTLYSKVSFVHLILSEYSQYLNAV